MARIVAPCGQRIPARHRHRAAEAFGNVEDWQHKAGRCVRVFVGPGQRGRGCPRVRVWVEGPGMGDRLRRGFIVPACWSAMAYARLLHEYLAFALVRRLGMSGHVLLPLEDSTLVPAKLWTKARPL